MERCHPVGTRANTTNMLPEINGTPLAPRQTKNNNPHIVEIEPIAITSNSAKITMARGNIISQEAVDFVISSIWRNW